MLPMLVTRSLLARQLPVPRAPVLRTKPVPWGVTVHTTGSGVRRKAAASGRTLMEAAIAVYLEPDDPTEGIYTAFPHYVLDSDGELVQVCDEARRARHVRVTPDDRDAYLSGDWRAQVAAEGLRYWDGFWVSVPSPSHLYPGKSPNDVYLGVELIPSAIPDGSGSLFSAAQYDRLGDLLEDIENRYAIKLDGRHLVGHEDLSPLTRWNAAGGWDPGALQAHPTFHWGSVKRHDGWPFKGLPGLVAAGEP